MKKIAKIFGGIFIAALFVAALTLFFRPYFTKNEEETTKKPLIVKTPKQIYELGEDMDVQGLVWNISEAELLEDYEKIDSYYKERGFLRSREQYVKECIEEHIDRDLFQGDIRFFRIKCSVTNHTDKACEFTPASLQPTSIIGSDMVSWYFSFYDVQDISNRDGNKILEMEGSKQKMGKYDKAESYTIQPEESMELEVVGELCLCDIYSIYSLQYSKDKNGSYDLYVMGENSTKRVHLNIAGSFDGNRTYPESRNIQMMKYQSWTNLEQMEWKKEWIEQQRLELGFPIEGYSLDREEKPILETEESGQEFLEFVHRGMINDKVGNAFSLFTTLTDFKITEWKDMPSDFAEQGNLQKMAQRYHDIYNCQEEELKVLVLDLNYTSSQLGELMDDDKTAVNYFYGRSKLYVKDEKNSLWLFGTADSWIVTENSAHPENIGSVNLDIMELDASISIRMAYILPPQLYENYSALYFSGGGSEITYDEDEIPMTKIVL